MATAPLLCQAPVQLHPPHHSPGAHTRVRPSPRHSGGSMLANPARLFGHANNQLNHSTPPIVPGQPGFNIRSSPSAASILSIMCRHVPSPPPSPSPQESCRLSRLPANSAHGLPLFNASQLAIDTTLVARLKSAGQPHRQGRQYAAAALQDARRVKERGEAQR